MIDAVVTRGMSATRVVLRLYAIIMACFIAVAVSAGYVIGAAAYYEGWSVAHTVAEASGVQETVIQELSANTATWVVTVIVYGPALAVLDTFIIGAARLGYATHSELFANALLLSMLVVMVYYTGSTVKELYYGGSDHGD